VTDAQAIAIIAGAILAGNPHDGRRASVREREALKAASRIAIAARTSAIQIAEGGH
jgi:hypothetical protein